MFDNNPKSPLLFSEWDFFPSLYALTLKDFPCFCFQLVKYFPERQLCRTFSQRASTTVILVSHSKIFPLGYTHIFARLSPAVIKYIERYDEASGKKFAKVWSIRSASANYHAAQKMNKNYSNVTLKEKAIFLFDLAHHLIFHKAASQKSIKNYFPAF